MTIRHLKIFTTVADEKGMSAAAKKLHISQPSVSQAIAELEKYYGVKLFERLSQKIYLTKEGELMLSFSRHILDSFDQMEEAMNQSVEHTHLHIGCSVSVGTCLINDILDKAKEMSLTQMISTANTVIPLLATDMTKDEILAYIRQLAPMLPDLTVVNQRIPADGMYQLVRIDGKSVIKVNFEKAQKLLEETIGD